ncbi:MAG: DUF488 family protein [Verrucomicrobiaceae bacterium]|nr:MAG: DUF488 family protein [Verrucomicrobiaceae bacterium]
MSVRLYCYASVRQPGEGLRIGVSRHVPRGVRREVWAAEGWFDSWLPLFAPSAPLVGDYVKRRISFAVFSRRYRAEMKRPECLQVIRLLGAFSLTAPVSVGCFCEEEQHCHRAIPRELVLKNLCAYPVRLWTMTKAWSASPARFVWRR